MEPGWFLPPNQATLDQAAAHIVSSGCGAHAIVTDVSKREDVNDLAAETIKLF